MTETKTTAALAVVGIIGAIWVGTRPKATAKKKKSSAPAPLPPYQEYIEPGQTLTYTYKEFLARERSFLLDVPFPVKSLLGGQLRVSMTSSWTDPFTSVIEPMGSVWSQFSILPSGLAHQGVRPAAHIEVNIEWAGIDYETIYALLSECKVDPWHMENGKEMEYNVVMESGGVSHSYQIKIVP